MKNLVEYHDHIERIVRDMENNMEIENIINRPMRKVPRTELTKAWATDKERYGRKWTEMHDQAIGQKNASPVAYADKALARILVAEHKDGILKGIENEIDYKVVCDVRNKKFGIKTKTRTDSRRKGVSKPATPPSQVELKKEEFDLNLYKKLMNEKIEDLLKKPDELRDYLLAMNIKSKECLLTRCGV
jgi:hypothetical protein